jgi:aspartyl-tRNA synthetase
MRLTKPFVRLTYRESMERYGSDKPDLRYGLEIKDISDVAGSSGFEVFRSIVAGGGIVRGICAPGCAGYSRKQLDVLAGFVKDYGAKGLITLPVGESQAASILDKHLDSGQREAIVERFGAAEGDIVLIVAGETAVVEESLGALRQEMARRLELLDPNAMVFCFILDYPLLEKAADGRWEPMHHPFTSPKDGDIPLLDSSPDKVHAKHYDLVCNGCELSSGSIRIHNSELQHKIFELLGYSQQEIEGRFGHLIEAFQYGAPPHGGIAPGIDRVVMLLAGEESIREVIPFPKNKSAIDMMFDAPSEVSEEQLKDLHLKLRFD